MIETNRTGSPLRDHDPRGLPGMHRSDESPVTGHWMLRALAGVTVALILLAWLGSLSAEHDLLRANVIRVFGAIGAAVIAWVTDGPPGRRRHGKLPWKRCLSAGVVGSLAVTGVSIFASPLGGFGFAGWLASGITGGVVVVLAGYALTGGAPREARQG